MPKKQPITIAIPLNCNKHTCGSCQCKRWDDECSCYYCGVFDRELISKDCTLKRLPECKAAEIKGE